jgi:hypothetical protein
VAAPSAAVVAPPSAAVVAPAAAAPTPARAPAAPAPARAAAAPASAPARAVAAPALAPPATGPCQLYVASHPPAELWLDGRNTGRRTPVSGLQVGCGDHRLVLKRDDLELYQMEMITVRSGTPFRKTYPLR